jgi:hypothetical protein
MSIVRNLTPPAKGTAVVSAALSDLQVLPHNQDSLGGGIVNLSEPLPIFQLQLTNIVAGSDFGSAILVGWRYLVLGSTPLHPAYADVRHVETGESQFASFANNKNAVRLLEAVKKAEIVAKNISMDCEARILDVPAFKFSAVWLYCGDESRLIAFIDPSDKKILTVWEPKQLWQRFLAEAAVIRASNFSGGGPPRPRGGAIG